MAFEGFTDKDFDTYAPAHRVSATFMLQRRQVKEKLKALMAEVMAAVGEDARGLELVFSSEVPSLENNRSVAEQGAYLVRGATDRTAVKALVEKMSLRSAAALDVAEFHKHASIGVVVDDQGVRACLAYHPRGQVDRQNLKVKLAEAWAQEALLALLHGLPDAFTVQFPGMPAPVAPAAVTAEALLEAAKALDGDGACTLVRARPRAEARGPLAAALAEDVRTLLAAYHFGAWTAEHDHIQAAKQAKAQREEARKGHDLLPGARVRILAGLWAGKTGVVENVDKKGGLRVQVGVMSVKIDSHDVTPA